MHDLRSWDAWRAVHQPFELDWWKTALLAGHSRSPGFENQWAPVKEFIKPEPPVLDIGCGPRPPFAPCTVIDPLAYEYWDLTPPHWWEGVITRAVPAEQYIPALEGKFATLICWNALDHLIGWREVLDNMLHYAKSGARFALATDFHPPFTGHPGFDRKEFEEEIAKRFTILQAREPFGRQLALLMQRRGE